MLAEPLDGDAEAFRILRANVEFASVDTNTPALMVTGAIDGEGRSTTAANLALAAALAGRNVVLVDLDLRHPSLDRLFRLEGQPGLTDVALGHVALEDALVPIEIHPRSRSRSSDRDEDVAGRLRVLTSGPAPPDSGEFVASRAVEEIVAELRRRSEMLIVDSPPLLPVGDARTLSRLMDRLIVVLDTSIARRSLIQELRRVLDALPAPALGFVATGTGFAANERYRGVTARRRSQRRTRLAA